MQLIFLFLFFGGILQVDLEVPSGTKPFPEVCSHTGMYRDCL